MLLLVMFTEVWKKKVQTFYVIRGVSDKNLN